MTKYKKLNNTDYNILEHLTNADLKLIERYIGCARSTIYLALSNKDNLKKGTKQARCFALIVSFYQLNKDIMLSKENMLNAGSQEGYIQGLKDGGKYGNILPGITE